MQRHHTHFDHIRILLLLQCGEEPITLTPPPYLPTPQTLMFLQCTTPPLCSASGEKPSPPPPLHQGGLVFTALPSQRHAGINGGGSHIWFSGHFLLPLSPSRA